MAEIKPLEVNWSEAEVEAVLGQVRAYPWPPIPDVPDGWAYGCDAGYLNAARIKGTYRIEKAAWSGDMASTEWEIEINAKRY